MYIRFWFTHVSTVIDVCMLDYDSCMSHGGALDQTWGAGVWLLYACNLYIWDFDSCMCTLWFKNVYQIMFHACLMEECCMNRIGCGGRYPDFRYPFFTFSVSNPFFWVSTPAPHFSSGCANCDHQNFQIAIYARIYHNLIWICHIHTLWTISSQRSFGCANCDHHNFWCSFGPTKQRWTERSVIGTNTL